MVVSTPSPAKKKSTAKSSYLAYQHAMKSPFLAINPGMTFGQRSKYTVLRYAEEKGASEDKNSSIVDQLFDANPTLPLVKFNDVRHIIALALKQDALIQKQWWPLDQIVAIINHLNQVSRTSALTWNLNISSKQVLLHLRKCSSFVAQSEKDYRASFKKIFIQSLKSGNRNCTQFILIFRKESKWWNMISVTQSVGLIL